ncbi:MULTISPECIES: restriction endonuclease subunit S [Streptomyces]|nr:MULTISPECIES: restriction endonuclease subunit S [Streptomyces]OFA52367.1 hypothetical protein BEN35_11960 [Streptomyces fradiae]
MQGDVPYWGAGGILDSVDTALFDEPLVLLGEDGAPFFTPGKDVAYYVEGPSWINNHIHALRPDSVDGRYLAYALNSVDYANYITGATRDKLTQDDLKKIEVWNPPTDEQRRIADFLDTETTRIDTLTNARKWQLSCLEQLWQARLAAKTEELLAAHGMISLRRMVTSVEQGWSPQCEDVETSPSEWAVLKTSAVSTGTFVPTEHKRLPSDIKPDFRYRITDGDILLTRGSGSPAHVGVAVVAHTEGRKLLLSDLLYRVRIDHDWSPEFVTLMLSSPPVRSFMSLLFRGQSGQTIKLRSEDVKAIDIPAAPVGIQAGIARQLEITRSGIRRTQQAIRRSLTLFAERRQALITAAVTGQFDVSTASGRNVTDNLPEPEGVTP